MEEIIFDPIERKEFFLANLGGQDITPPDPVTRIERYLQDMIDGNASTIPPITRMEYYLAKISGADVAIPDPVTRTEYYLAKIAGMEVDVPDPVTREEWLLVEWAESMEHTYGPAALVSFMSSKAKLVKSLLIDLQPIQDLHGYDYPWPGGGGMNILPAISQTGNGFINDYRLLSDGTTSPMGTYYISQYFPVTPGKTYTYTVVNYGSETTSCAAFYDSEYNFISAITGKPNGNEAVAPSNAAYMRASNTKPGADPIRYTLNEGPYSNICPITGFTGANIYVSPTTNQSDATVYNVDWTSAAGTVYGGTVDVVSGKLMVTWASVDMGTMDWVPNASLSGRFDSGSLGQRAVGVKNVVCSKYKVIDASESTSTDCWVRGGANVVTIVMRNTSYDGYTNAQVKTALSGTQLVYELATPIEYTITPQTVTALLGQNYVWANAVDVTVKV